MRTSQFGLLVSVLVLLWGCGGGGGSTSLERQEANPFTELDAYGEWIEYPGLGHVWQPRVGYEWQPFTAGRWVWTDQGWLWYSDEPFGWAVYHYGYWVNEGASGWLWVPGYEWSPARVRWVVREDVIGWAPLPPPGRDLPFATRAGGWVAVHPRQFTQRNVGRYRGQAPQPKVDPGAGDDTRRPPEVKMIERATNIPVETERFDTEPVGKGERKIIRVRVAETRNQPPPSPRQELAPLPSTPAPRVAPPPVKPEVQPPPQRQGALPPAKSSRPPAIQKGKKAPPATKEQVRTPEQKKDPKVKKPPDSREGRSGKRKNENSPHSDGNR